MNNKKTNRLYQICDYVTQHGQTSIKEMAAHFAVSELTIRRDIKTLEEEEKLQNIRGVIISNRFAGNKIYSINSAKAENYDEKDRIGAYAAGMIVENDVIMIDNGTTTEMMAKYIPDDIHITVLCYNINILNWLIDKPNITIIFGGGLFHQETLMFESKESLEIIRRTRATKAFISAAGVHYPLGVTCTTSYELESKREAMSASAKKYLLVDSSKFGQLYGNYICDYHVFDMIITDDKIAPEWKKRLKEQSIKHIIL